MQLATLAFFDFSLQLLGFVASYLLNTDSLYDVMGALTFITLACLSYFLGPMTSCRQVHTDVTPSPIVFVPEL